jgi:glycosyltransferase involved in cell wall biosynthesis
VGKAWLWAADEGGCGWYRTVIVAEALRKLGHDVGSGIKFDGESYGDCDAILGQRICIPGTSIAWSRWNFQQSKRTVFDADDDYFHLSEHPEFGQSAVEYGNSRIQSRLLANASSSNYTTCVSPVIAEMFGKYCSNVVVVPNGLPERYLDRPAPWERAELADPGHRPVVGWAGSSFTQWELTAGIKDMMRSVSGWGGQLHTVGAMYPEMRKQGLAEPGVRITGWIPDSATYLDEIDFDIWLAPYRRTNYNNAKAPTKALEAAFLGIPIVASDTTPYRAFVKDGETGFLVPPGGDWETPVRELINNPDLRQQMGRAARQQAAEFTIEKLAAQYWEPLLFGEIA